MGILMFMNGEWRHFLSGYRCKKNDIPIEKVYNKTQREKFRWAIDMAGPDFVFWKWKPYWWLFMLLLTLLFVLHPRIPSERTLTRLELTLQWADVHIHPLLDVFFSFLTLVHSVGVCGKTLIPSDVHGSAWLFILTMYIVFICSMPVMCCCYSLRFCLLFYAWCLYAPALA